MPGLISGEYWLRNGWAKQETNCWCLLLMPPLSQEWSHMCSIILSHVLKKTAGGSNSSSRMVWAAQSTGPSNLWTSLNFMSCDDIKVQSNLHNPSMSCPGIVSYDIYIKWTRPEPSFRNDAKHSDAMYLIAMRSLSALFKDAWRLNWNWSSIVAYYCSYLD